MQQPSTPAPSPTAASFAGLLAALASPAPKPLPEPWSDDDLADDVATLSYEHALRTHARYRAAGPSGSDQSLTQIPDPEPIRRIQGPLGDEFEAPAPQTELRTAPIAAPDLSVSAQPEPEVNPFHAAQLERNLKDASITIRMSHTESEQLRRRAAEAGLTVSAYLRSCTFEVESLRAMVKDTVAQLRTAQATQKIAENQPARAGWFSSITRWLSRLLTPWQDARRVARA